MVVCDMGRFLHFLKLNEEGMIKKVGDGSTDLGDRNILGDHI